MKKKMLNLHKKIRWEGVRAHGNKLIIRAMDERDFDPDYQMGMVKDNYDDSIAFEVVKVGDSVMGLKEGDIVAVANPALDFLGHERMYSCDAEDVIFSTTRDKQPPETEEELLEGWVK